MIIHFYKYHGAGNDFIIIDQYKNQLKPLQQNQLRDESIAMLCHRQFGIGADGLIILKAHKKHDFEMLYYNSDGNLATLCGNGSRCAVRFMYDHKYTDTHTTFHATDGKHYAEVIDNELVSVHFHDIDSIQGGYLPDLVVDTGSPHYIKFVKQLDSVDVNKEGTSIRNQEPFKNEGINVNFCEVKAENQLKLFTYERGVEAETYACGTGVVATAIAYLQKIDAPNSHYHIKLQAKGGNLEVKLDKNANSHYQNIELIGPAVYVFEGDFDISLF